MRYLTSITHNHCVWADFSGGLLKVISEDEEMFPQQSLQLVSSNGKDTTRKPRSANWVFKCG